VKTFRRHAITGEEILFAPQRASRRGAWLSSRAESGDLAGRDDDRAAQTASSLDYARDDDERCPFCPGHESDTPAEIARIGGAQRWKARVFPNRYPAIAGAEVIVESPDHDARFESIDHAREIVALYADRYRAHRDAAYTALFKNEGSEAGASIPHLHSQLLPLPFVPPRIARERDAFANANACPLCAVLETVIVETDSFRWIAPVGSWMPYQQWIVPRRHVSAISELDDRELAEAGALLQKTSSATGRIAPAFNWTFMNFPGVAKAHAYIDVLPRMTTIAGLELGTGTFVEIIDPAAAAERLRS